MHLTLSACSNIPTVKLKRLFHYVAYFHRLIIVLNKNKSGAVEDLSLIAHGGFHSHLLTGE